MSQRASIGKSDWRIDRSFVFVKSMCMELEKDVNFPRQLFFLHSNLHCVRFVTAGLHPYWLEKVINLSSAVREGLEPHPGLVEQRKMQIRERRGALEADVASAAHA